ncbi:MULTISPECIES: cold-shock protein [Winogradskyella]|uniref:Cold shock domain-containing protein n=1 Tax=Winogradskyella aquimaris TaxID=864074 RepID=A0ABU5EPI9_9FLAO|nr:cold shock domain-containing protein [Winogradskyella aquimaris]MCB0399820.1 cold-shock protein [Winogradskyella sp.]MDY2587981.1 cold shock domain-containing protein [Winogradskyella aquimaris]
MQEGTVKFFNNAKGFGFITSKDSNEDIFVHSTGLIDNIKEDDKVQFKTEQGKKGLNAIDVEVVW